MTHGKMISLGEVIAKQVVGQVLDATTDATALARMTVLVGHQLMMMGQAFAANAGLDFVDVYREELDRAGMWHDQIAAMLTARRQA